MLADFQQALADMVASPSLCREVRAKPARLHERYRLSGLEYNRLVDMSNQPGMRCNCIVYRANRLAPLALNLNATCKALGDQLTPLVDAFWAKYPESSVNFLEECDRFCRFLRGEHYGAVLNAGAREAFRREAQDLELRIRVMRAVL